MVLVLEGGSCWLQVMVGIVGLVGIVPVLDLRGRSAATDHSRYCLALTHWHIGSVVVGGALQESGRHGRHGAWQTSPGVASAIHRQTARKRLMRSGCYSIAGHLMIYPTN